MTDPRALRQAFGKFPTGVTVVTTRTATGVPLGFTANSFSSVSLDPPLLLVCPAKGLSSFAEFSRVSSFAVNILAEGQEAISNRFASFTGDRFADISWREDEHGCPLLEGTAAWFSCNLEQSVDAGDHTILIGRILRFGQSEAAGLGYAQGNYFSLGLERRAATSSDRPAFAGALIEQNDHILLQRTDRGWTVPILPLDTALGVRERLVQGYAVAGVDVHVGNVYSVYDDNTQNRHLSFYLAAATAADPGALGQYVPIAELADLPFADKAISTMLNRYRVEHRSKVFGLYLGDDISGAVHPF